MKCIAFFLCLLLCACTGQQKNNTDSSADTTTDTASDGMAPPSRKYILFFGNSLTAGYGLDEDQSFPSLIQARIDSIGLPYQVINGGLSGETSAGGLNRIDWVLRQQIDVFVLELGPNDALRGLDLKSTDQNLRGIVDAVQKKYPNIPIIIVGMEAPPNMGAEYTTAFRNVFRDIANDYNARLIPFLLEGVGGKPELNLPDRMHPNAEGQKIVAENVWRVLKDVL
jgi:acyl-CoA thioesterase-1